LEATSALRKVSSFRN
jgi:hypothetical protein